MLLGSGNGRGRRSHIRDALRSARETYREYSGAPVERPSAERPRETPVEPLPAERSRETPVERLPAERPRETLVRTQDPDVVLDVPALKVDEIDLDLDELKARVALEAHVLELLKLDVGVDASLGRVALKIKGVEAQAHLKVRLDNLATILDRVMDTIDRNPKILENLTESVGEAVGELGTGAGEAVGELGTGAGEAVGEVGSGAGEAVGELGSGAGEAVGEVGSGVGDVVGDVGSTVEEVGRVPGRVVDGDDKAAEPDGT